MGAAQSHQHASRENAECGGSGPVPPPAQAFRMSNGLSLDISRELARQTSINMQGGRSSSSAVQIRLSLVDLYCK